MNTPKIPFSISFFTNLTESFRIFVIGSIISIYGLVLYELYPEIMFNPNLSIPSFVIPMTALAAVGIGLPRFMPLILEKILKRPVTAKPVAPSEDTSDDILNELVTEGSAQQLVQQGTGEMPTDTEGIELPPESSQELDALIDKAVKAEKLDENIVGLDPDSLGKSSLGGMGEDKVRDLIDQKFEPVEKDLSSFKKDLNKIKEDMKITKESVDTLTESFEGTLTDMKAFQAEISNPLNFMRKYFESIDLRSLQDPSLPLRQQLQDRPIELEKALSEPKVITVPQTAEPVGQGTVAPTHSAPQSTGGISTEQPAQPSPMDSVMKPLFSGNLSVGKMMSIVELAGDMLREQGDDCIDLLLEQCKLMGLKSEDENTIYNIIDMLKNSGMKVEDSLIQLYKFSKIVGLNDREADAHYTKLMATRDRAKLKKGE